MADAEELKPGTLVTWDTVPERILGKVANDLREDKAVKVSLTKLLSPLDAAAKEASIK